MFSIKIPIHPHKDSDGMIGMFFKTYKKKDVLYGKFYMGIYFGKYLLSYSPKRKWGFCNYFATGTGG